MHASVRQLGDPDLQELEMSRHPPNQSGSTWEIDIVYAMRIFFDPLDQLDLVLPRELEPDAGSTK